MTYATTPTNLNGGGFVRGNANIAFSLLGVARAAREMCVEGASELKDGLAEKRYRRYLDAMSQISMTSAAVKKTVKGRSMKITIGNVTVMVTKPNAEQVKRNVESSTLALERDVKKLNRPGVRIYAKKGVPLYSADPEQPGLYIRSLNGQEDRGVLEGGSFKVTG